MLSTAVENYLKHIYTLGQADGPERLVGMGRLAETLGVVPGTATAMVKRLAKARLLTYEPYGGVRLTSRGQAAALRVLRRHRLVESLLVHTLGLDWSEVHDEAERLEHAVSDKLLDRIDAVLGFPSVDPHGDPIPGADGSVRAASATALPLADCAPGQQVRVERALDQDERFLRFIDAHGLRPGSTCELLARDDAADAITVRTMRHGQPITMGRAAALKLLVEPILGARPRSVR